jgi:MFS family permease
MKPPSQSPNRALGLISFSVLLATSTWFSGTAATPVLRELWTLTDVQCSWLTVSVQLGFILGTFLYALFNLPDLFPTRIVFFASAGLAALFNSGFALLSTDLNTSLAFRFLTGIALAGVYPVGMKLVAQWFRSGLGWRLGILLAALTLGTASPYLMFALGAAPGWRLLLLTASGLSLLGGCVVLFFVPQGPYLREAAVFEPRMALRIFFYREFRLQAFGYFGHMWELYAFWSLAAMYLTASFRRSGSSLGEYVPLLTFFVIAAGSAGCILGGWISRRAGERKVALVSLVVSGSLCGMSWWIFDQSAPIVAAGILFWGIFVIADSPQFSALAARHCPPRYTGTALTIQNGIGFGITVLSIQLTAGLGQTLGWKWAFISLAVGPLLGASALSRLRRSP